MVELRQRLSHLGLKLAPRVPELFALTFAAALFFYLGYGPTLDPTFVAWMWRDDWSTYQWGFSFFRNAPWSWPLGSVPNLFYPHGTSVGFTDANPWMCVLFKLLSPLLPRDFQFSGMWYLLCFVLQAWFGVQICRRLTRDPVQVALGGALFASTPVLPMRAYHIALSALFFVTAGLWLNLSRAEQRREAWRGVALSLSLLVWAAGTHAYLSAMLLTLCFSYYARLCFVDRLLAVRELLGCVFCACGLTLVVYYLFGFIGWKQADLAVPGFGQFSADLLAIFNSMGISRFVPAIQFQPSQWEGYAYLGLGGLLLLGIFVWRACTEQEDSLRRLRSHWPLALVVTGMFVYALSSLVTFRGELVLDLSALYAPLNRLTGVFRSSGRFAWPLHLLLLAAGIRAVVFERSPNLSRGLLLLALGLTVAEQDRHRLQFPAVPLDAPSHPAWLERAKDYAHLEIVPLQLRWECPYNPALVDALANLAYRGRFTFNSGNFMRKEPGTRALCGRDVSVLDGRTIYVVEPDRVARMRAQNALCGLLDGLYVCVTKRATALGAVLALSPIP